MSLTEKDLKDLASKGHSYTVEYVVDAEVVISESGAIVRDCERGIYQMIDTQTREELEPEENVVKLVETSLRLSDGTWKIVKRQELSGTCTPAS